MVTVLHVFRMLGGSLASERTNGHSWAPRLTKDCFPRTLRSVWSKHPQRVVSRRVDLDICRQTSPPWSLMYWWQLSIRRDNYHIRGNDQLKEASGDTIPTQIIKKISKHDVIVWSTLTAKPSYPCFCLFTCEQQRIDVCFVGTLVTSTCNLCLFKEELKWEFYV